MLGEGGEGCAEEPCPHRVRKDVQVANASLGGEERGRERNGGGDVGGEETASSEANGIAMGRSREIAMVAKACHLGERGDKGGECGVRLRGRVAQPGHAREREQRDAARPREDKLRQRRVWAAE